MFYASNHLQSRLFYKKKSLEFSHSLALLDSGLKKVKPRADLKAKVSKLKHTKTTTTKKKKKELNEGS
jgi:hypothetical protein